jgi:hypothetical protein
MQAEFLTFHPPELEAIYLGCRSSQEDQDAIMAMAKSINPKVEVFTAKKSECAFTLEFSRVT